MLIHYLLILSFVIAQGCATSGVYRLGLQESSFKAERIGVGDDRAILVDGKEHVRETGSERGVVFRVPPRRIMRSIRRQTLLSGSTKTPINVLVLDASRDRSLADFEKSSRSITSAKRSFANPADGGATSIDDVQIPNERHRKLWAYPAQAVLYPLAICADVIALPIYAVMLFQYVKAGS